MARTVQSRKRWQVVGGSIVLVALAGVIVLGELGAGQAARGLGLALFFLVWPLIFLAVAPPAKPGLDPVTAKYYTRPGAASRSESLAGSEFPDDDAQHPTRR